MRPDYGIIVPVRNESAVLPVSVSKLINVTRNDKVRIVWALNGCTDNSAALIRQYAGARAEIVETTSAGKTAALQAGDDALGNLFPRLYLDADVWFEDGGISRLMQPLIAGTADLVAPRLRVDGGSATAVSVMIAECWLSLPHARSTAFSNAIGLSESARGLWKYWPKITGDDIFVSAKVPSQRRVVVHEALATISIPRDFMGWARMRSRWLMGQRELAAMGLKPPSVPGQRAALFGRMLRPEFAPGAFAYTAARLLGMALSSGDGSGGWIPDRVRHNGEGK